MDKDNEFLGACPVCKSMDVECLGYGEYTHDYQCKKGHTWQTLSKEFVITNTIKE